VRALGYIVASLVGRFEELERREVARIGEVLDFVESDGCLWARLAAHFGEELAGPCGRCTFCRTGARVHLPAATPPPPFPAAAELAELATIGEPRCVARLLCADAHFPSVLAAVEESTGSRATLAAPVR
jgi:ATP-dependent DNA helicase RecQ